MNSTMFKMGANFLLQMHLQLTILCKRRLRIFATNSVYNLVWFSKLLFWRLNLIIVVKIARCNCTHCDCSYTAPVDHFWDLKHQKPIFYMEFTLTTLLYIQGWRGPSKVKMYWIIRLSKAENADFQSYPAGEGYISILEVLNAEKL